MVAFPCLVKGAGVATIPPVPRARFGVLRRTQVMRAETPRCNRPDASKPGRRQHNIRVRRHVGLSSRPDGLMSETPIRPRDEVAQPEAVRRRPDRVAGAGENRREIARAVVAEALVRGSAGRRSASRHGIAGSLRQDRHDLRSTDVSHKRRRAKLAVVGDVTVGRVRVSCNYEPDPTHGEEA
jgi:hypothetical protein